MKALRAIRPARPTRRGVAFAIAALIAATALLAATAVDLRSGLLAGQNEFNLPAWELRNLPAKWLFLFGQAFRGKPGFEEQNADLEAFFQLTRDIDALERAQSDADQRGQAPDGSRTASLREKRRQRDRLENQVEATIEQRITTALRAEHIERSGLGFSVVWPPVDFEFTDAPRTLVTSPRAKIQLKSTDLLRSDLNLAQVEAVESETERNKGVSALAFRTSGVGAYPTIVDYTADYKALLSLVAHEWTHNYLFFRPLGFNYYDSNDLRTMNETVADLIGEEIAGAVLARWPLPSAAPPPPAETSTQPQRPAVDAGAVLRQLRMEVDALLAAGRLDEAEALMEQRRQELAAQGVFIRRINQAYFAFTNLYAGAAGNPAAVNPIGPKIDDLRRRTGTLADFVRVMGNVTSVAELDAALSKYESR